MKRRQMASMVTALSAVVLAGRAIAANEHAHHGKTGGTPASGKHAALITATGDCIAKGEACLSHCLVLLGQGDKAMADCAQSVNQMLATCTALQKLAAQEAKATKAMAKLALDVCQECEKACRKHEQHHAVCKACAESCAECVKQCKAAAV